MHVYQGYKHQPYSAETAGGHSRRELERMYEETHNAAPAAKKRSGDLIERYAPRFVLAVGVLVSVASIVMWTLGYDLIAPMLAMMLMYEALFLYMVMS